ncbi:CD209 antigen-like protein E [Girardinichthys multiradiatus]|uniref:CD209 antigen-like protein E n=1 Tax=Girardinichthys multiradiatus TaxID=208333 RepID=UPI001FAE31D6|nr:CD209 antigen-like protein E [Girardinichthys multiradiatus]
MVRAVREEVAEISIDYVNQPDASTRSQPNLETGGNHAAPGRKSFRLVAIGFGLLCILQAALNISLRLTLYKQPPVEEIICRNETDDMYNLRQQIKQYLQRGWLYFQDSLYYISSTKKTWQESREFCLQQDANLVIINTKEEQNFTRQFERFTWIGLRNLSMTGEWTWVDGAPLTNSYWGPGEPNNLAGTNENCVEVRFFELENSWNDIPCDRENFWICEKDAAF